MDIYDDWINEFKQYDDIILEEVNVKEHIRELADTEKGALSLKYDGDYTVLLDGKPIETSKEFILKTLEQCYG